ncbi:MAG: hypothetical protein C4527_12170 [Candidatus Omnitrophota bacterium]|nr:MAG: hypothetical protein C4527_12170 [Candidatus Omnitrophota bacterium]
MKDRYLGIDDDVREIFFNLPPEDLEMVFRAYGRKYGEGKKRFAKQTFKKWKSGIVQMSGKISERLVVFLPPYLKFENKYDLVKKLWINSQPQTFFELSITPEQGFEEVVELIAKTIKEKLETNISESLKERLNWLCQNNAKKAEELLKKVFEKEGEIILKSVSRELRDISEYIRTEKDVNIIGVKEIKIANSTIIVNLKRAKKFWRFLMGDNSSNNLPDKTSVDQQIDQIDKNISVLEEGIKSLTPEQKNKLFEEIVKLKFKVQESKIDIDISREKLELIVEVVRKLPEDVLFRYIAKSTHKTPYGDTEIIAKKGCFTTFAIIISTFSLLLAVMVILFAGSAG